MFQKSNTVTHVPVLSWQFMTNAKRRRLSLTFYRGITGPSPRGITVNVVPLTAGSPRLPRYSRRPHYRADLIAPEPC